MAGTSESEPPVISEVQYLAEIDRLKVEIEELKKKKKPSVVDRDMNLKKLEIVTQYFGNDLREKTDLNDDQCAYAALQGGVSTLFGGIPGVDDAKNDFFHNRVSRGRKGRIEMTDILKAGNTAAQPTYYPAGESLSAGHGGHWYDKLAFWRH